LFNGAGGASGLREIEGIWEFLFRTGNREIIEYLLRCYRQPVNQSLCAAFLEQCLKHLPNQGSLLAIARLVHLTEDGNGLPINRFLFDDELCTIQLGGWVTSTVKIPSWISLEGFVRVVASQVGVLNFRLYVDQTDLTPATFHPSPGLTILVEVADVFPDQIILASRPSLLLQEQRFQSQLFALLDEGDEKLALLVLEILNSIPPFPVESAQLTASPKWKNFFCIDSSFHLLYRIHLLGNRIRSDQEFASVFYNGKGLSALLGMVITVSSSLFTNTSCLLFLVKFTNWILTQIPNNDISSALGDLSEPVPALLAWISTCSDLPL
jgi:hypothetical protein